MLIYGAWAIWTAVWRLFFSPLSHIPGPKLAAVSYWYEFYYDVICQGRFLWKIGELHRQYGPIVRINPREVHINDHNFYDDIYAGGSKHPRHKIRFMAMHDDSMFDTYDEDKHRARRAAVGVAFSVQSIRKLEPTIRASIEELASRMAALVGTNQVVNLQEMYGGLTLDIISCYCFGERMDNLKQDQFGKAILDCFHEMPKSHPVGRMFPWLFNMIQYVPVKILARLDPKLQPLADFEAKLSGQLQSILSKSRRTDGVRTVFHEMRDSTRIPESDKTLKRFKDEAAIFLGAGTETSSAALTVISYHLTNKPDMMRRLREELQSIPNQDFALSTLDTLPYLTSVVKEGIRLSFGVPGRLPRVAPTEELVYAGYKLPPGTVLSESSYLLHTDPTIFTDPFEFQPDRWLHDKALAQRYFVPFSRGSRMCIGMNLAYAELHLTAAIVFSRFNFELQNTTKRDVELCHDFFVGMPAMDSQGVRVKITKDYTSS
ncbi:cytochrome P450 [Trichoderma velutinum]